MDTAAPRLQGHGCQRSPRALVLCVVSQYLFQECCLYMSPSTHPLIYFPIDFREGQRALLSSPHLGLALGDPLNPFQDSLGSAPQP